MAQSGLSVEVIVEAMVASGRRDGSRRKHGQFRERRAAEGQSEKEYGIKKRATRLRGGGCSKSNGNAGVTGEVPLGCGYEDGHAFACVRSLVGKRAAIRVLDASNAAISAALCVSPASYLLRTGVCRGKEVPCAD